MQQMWSGLVRPAGGGTEQERPERSWTRYELPLNRGGSPNLWWWCWKAGLERGCQTESPVASRSSTPLAAVTTPSLMSSRTSRIRWSRSSPRIAGCGGGLRPWGPRWLDLAGSSSSLRSEPDVPERGSSSPDGPVHKDRVPSVVPRVSVSGFGENRLEFKTERKSYPAGTLPFWKWTTHDLDEPAFRYRNYVSGR
jgi:hypothetical protein